MGFGPFRGRTIHYVNVSTSTLNEDIAPYKLGSILLRAIRQGKQNLSQELQYANLTGYRGQLLNLFNTANRDYIYGIPETDLSNNAVNVAEVKAVLDDIYTPVVHSIVDSYLYKLIPIIWAYWWLQENDGTFDYDNLTVVQASTTYDVVGATLNTAKTQMTIQLDNGGTPATYATTVTDMPNWDDHYYVVEYWKDTATTTRFMWVYQASLGTHPTLDVDVSYIYEPMYPIIPIRINDANVNVDKTSELYLTTKSLLQTVSMDIDELVTGVTKQENDDEELVDVPDLDKISDIFYMYALNIYGQEPVQKKALYNLFTELESQARLTEAQYTSQLSSNFKVTDNSFVISSATFDFEVTFSYITITDTAGSPLDLDEYSVTYYPLSDLPHSIPDQSDQQIPNSYILIRHQYEASKYKQIEVRGLWVNHIINSGGGPKNSPIYITTYTPGDDLTDDQKNFIIPLRLDTVSSLSPKEADQLISISNHIQAYAADSQYVKWYRTGAFAAFLKVVAFVAFIWDWTGTTTELLLAMAYYAVIKYAFEYVLVLLLEHFEGNDFLIFLTQVVAVVVLINLTSTDFLKMPGVDQLLTSVTAFSSVQITSAQVVLEDVRVASEAFEKELEEALATIEEAEDAMNPERLLDLTDIIDVTGYKYETPDDFYTRTLQTNPGILAFDHLHNYVDINLNLEYIHI
jgi:hypothetical protein